MATTSIAINITGNTAGISKKIDLLNKQLSSMGSRATGARTRMAGLGNSFTGIMGKASALSAGFLGIAAAIRTVTGTIKTLANFSFEMSKVEAISGATGRTLEEMSQLARKMGATTMYTATEAASALKFLSMAGFDAKQSMAALPATLDLAQAGTIELGRAADIASNIMAAYKIETERTNVVVDDMVSIVNNANTNVQQLGDAMKYVGAAAAASGVTIPTTAAAIGVLSNAGMQGAMAGTGLRQVFIRLTNVTGASEDALKGMGLTLDQVNPQMVGLTAAITRLKEAGMTGGEAIQIFGARGAVAALNLAKGLPKYHELKDIMETNEGIANKTANTMQTNLLGSFKLLKSAVQEAILAWGDKGFTGGLKDAINTLTELVRIMAGTGDPLSKFHMTAMRIKIALDEVVKISVNLFKVWVVAKIMAWVVAIGKFAVGLRVALMATIGLTGGMAGLATAISMTGIGALAVLLGYAASQMLDLGSATEAAAESQKRLKKAREEWIEEKTNLDPDKDEGGGGTGRIDAKDLTAFKDIKTTRKMKGEYNRASEIEDRARENFDSMESALKPLFGKKGKFNEKQFNEWKDKNPFAEHHQVLSKFLKDMGVEGGVTYENLKIAKDKTIDQINKAATYKQKMANPENLAKLRDNIKEESLERSFRDSMGFLEKLIVQGNRAGGAADDTQSGKVALLGARKKKLATEVSGLEGRELGEREKERLADAKGELSVLSKQLLAEEAMLSAQRAGSKAMEEELELRREIEASLEQEKKLTQQIKEFAISGDVLKDKAAFDIASSLEEFKRIQDKIKETTVNGRVATDDSMEDDFLSATEAYEKILDSGKLTGLRAVGTKQNVKRLRAMRSRDYEQVEGEDGEMRYKAREMSDKDFASARAEQVNLMSKATDYAIGNVDKDIAPDMALSSAAKSAGDQLLKGLEEASKDMPAVKQIAENLRKEFDDNDVFDPKRFEEAVDKLGEAGVGLKEQLFNQQAKTLGQQDEYIAKQRAINLLRRQEINEINRALTADNMSVEMQKRKLKLLGTKAGGKQLTELESKQTMTEHMAKFEKALIDKQAHLKASKGRNYGVGELLSDEEIDTKMQAERALAADVISQEAAIKKGKGGKFGVSSLARIGGGGGVGPGGDPLLNAAELANKLMEQAQTERKRATALMSESNSWLGRIFKAQPKEKTTADFVSIQGG